MEDTKQWQPFKQNLNVKEFQKKSWIDQSFLFFFSIFDFKLFSAMKSATYKAAEQRTRPWLWWRRRRRQDVAPSWRRYTWRPRSPTRKYRRIPRCDLTCRFWRNSGKSRRSDTPPDLPRTHWCLRRCCDRWRRRTSWSPAGTGRTRCATGPRRPSDRDRWIPCRDPETKQHQPMTTSPKDITWGFGNSRDASFGKEHYYEKLL